MITVLTNPLAPKPPVQAAARVGIAVVDGKVAVSAEGKLTPSQATDVAALVARWSRYAKGEML